MQQTENPKPHNVVRPLRALSEAELSEAARRQVSAEPQLRQELVDENWNPNWYMLEVWPGQERITRIHLIARGFGVFVPEYRRDVIKRGRKRTERGLLFPGYLPVFSSDLRKQWWRVGSCPGVKAILCTTHKGEIPVVVPWQFIDALRVLENRASPVLMTVELDNVLENTRRKKRRHNRPKKPTIRPVDDNDIVAVRSYSALSEVLELPTLVEKPPEERNGLLRKALGLAA